MTRTLILAALTATPLTAATIMVPVSVHPFLEWGVADLEPMLVLEAEDGRTSFRRPGPDLCLWKYQDGPVTCPDGFALAPPPDAPPITGALVPPGASLPPSVTPGSPGGSFFPTPVTPIVPIPPTTPIPLPATVLLLIAALAALPWRKLT